MKTLRKAYGAQVVRLSALLLVLLLPLAALASCGQVAQPLFESLQLGIPAAALQSPVKGTLPDATELHLGITFKIDPRVLTRVGAQTIQPGQPSNWNNLPGASALTTAPIKRSRASSTQRGLS